MCRVSNEKCLLYICVQYMHVSSGGLSRPLLLSDVSQHMLIMYSQVAVGSVPKLKTVMLLYYWGGSFDQEVPTLCAQQIIFIFHFNPRTTQTFILSNLAKDCCLKKVSGPKHCLKQIIFVPVWRLLENLLQTKFPPKRISVCTCMYDSASISLNGLLEVAG